MEKKKKKKRLGRKYFEEEGAPNSEVENEWIRWEEQDLKPVGGGNW